MNEFDPRLSFGPATAAMYDNELRGDEDETVDFLERLAAGGRVLELAIGTGRIALPLVQRGLEVEGIELSAAMIARLREKPGGNAIPVTLGDMATVTLHRQFDVIYLVFNTIFNLLEQEDQVRCFENVAAHLVPGGKFVVEAGTPNWLYRLRDDQYVDAESVGVHSVTLDVARFDPVTQRLEENHVVLSRDGVQLFPIVTRYSWPSELDLMARIAGLRLHHRWGGWLEEPFTGESARHVSVYGQ